MIIRNALKWCDKKTEEIDVINDKHPYLKAFGLGCIEGAIETAVIVTPILFVKYIIANKKLDTLTD